MNSSMDIGAPSTFTVNKLSGVKVTNSQYDISQPVDYLDRKLFLDGRVSIQRFDVVAYPKLVRFEDTQRGWIWGPEEVSLMGDRADMQNASPAVKHIMISNLLRQTVLDSLQGKAPAQVFGPVASVPELEALTNIWTMFETNIHSRSYSHIIRNAIPDASEFFAKIHEIEPIVEMARKIGTHYDALYHANCRMELGDPIPVYDHKKLIWMALHSSYALESIRFMASFSTSLGLAESGIFIGNGKIIDLILQDEILHTEWVEYIIKQVIKTDPDFAKIAVEMKREVNAMYLDVINDEKHWAGYLMKYGPVIGLNQAIISDFVDFTANFRLKKVNVDYQTSVKTHPMPWFERHVDLRSQQTALQELESSDYAVGALSSDVRLEDLPEI